MWLIKAKIKDDSCMVFLMLGGAFMLYEWLK